MLRRLAIIAGAALLALIPAPAVAPAQTLTIQAVYTIVSTPRTDGTVVEMSVPAELLRGSHPEIIVRPGAENRIRP